MKMPPRFVINPAAIVNSTWTPRVHQYILGHENPSYVNSLWLGTVWNLFTVPYRVTTEVLKPLFNFQFGRALLTAVTMIPTVLVVFWYGITGRAIGATLTYQEAMGSVILSPEQSAEAVRRGFKHVITDMEQAFPVIMDSVIGTIQPLSE